MICSWSHTRLPNQLRFAFGLLFVFSFAITVHAQTATYHLHRDSTVFLLKTAGPDTASVAVQSVNLKNQPTGEYLIKTFDTQSGVPGTAGVIPAGSTVTFALWMKKTASQGTMFPRAKLFLNSTSGTSICVVTGATALSATLTKYTLTGTVSSNVTMTATDRFTLWVGVNLTASPGANNMAELDIEGTLNGNFDSLITVPLPVTPPSITNLSPNSGPVGTPVTITGTNFGSTQGTSTVTFNGTTATPTSWSTTSIGVPVPDGATTGPIVVSVAGQASNGVTFTVTPKIDSLTPNFGPVGTSVTISGSTFGATQGSSTVTFNGSAAAPTSWSATSIAVPVPAAATSGTVVVTVAGQASNGVTFTVTPKINSLTPGSGSVGTSVTITGTTFGATQGTSTVTFNGAAATPTSWSATSISVPVPAAATSGLVVVTVAGQASNGVNFTVPPVISSLTPNGGLPGTNITVSGSGFGATQGTGTITFNGTAATPTSWGVSSIVVPVPTGATTGNVVVTVQGVASNGQYFPVTTPPTASIGSPADNATFTVPAFITINANASDSDGTISKVEFFVANTKIGEDTTAPYSFLWRNVAAGSYSLSVAATDNLGATTRSAAIAITVNAMPVPPEGAPCPANPQSSSFQFIPHNVGDYTTQTISLAPCETIAVTETHDQMNDGNLGTNLKIAYYNNQGQVIHQQNYWGFFAEFYQFPDWTPEPFPWRGVRSPEGLPAYLYIEAVDVLGHGTSGRPYYPTDPIYSFSISRSPRANYNIGGTTLANAPTVPFFPYTYYGSLREEETQGQYYKFHLEPGQSVRATGLAEGNQSYGALFKLDIYDTAGNLLTTNAGGWTLVAAYGPEFYKTNFFTNPNATASDFYVRARTTLWPVYDFDLTLEMEACPIPSDFDPNTPDATNTGPQTTTSAEYQFPAALDTDILPNDRDLVPSDPNITGREVELWARLYRPSNFSGGPYPVIVLLHGNHGTCGTGSNPHLDNNSDYTYTGICPANYTVVPNHRGYDYLADKLASHGYVVVSINANRGITGSAPGTSGDDSLILARGRLVLRHLQRLSEWNTNGGTPASLGVNLQGKLDFTQVGLMGHSRGGEGVRAAYNIYTKPGTESTMWHNAIPNNITFKGVFEIGPTDARRDETGTGLQAEGTSWSVLLPMCDGDLAQLPGVRPFDRMLGLSSETPVSMKSTYTVWGANHNFYNTEWQIPESQTTCIGRANPQLWTNGAIGSSAQQTTSLASVLALFRGNVGAGADSNFNKNFNTRYGLPSVVTSVTKVERGFMPSFDSVYNLVGDDFPQSVSTDLCAAGSGDDCSGVTATVGTVDNHDSNLHAALINWLSSGANTYYQDNWAAAGSGIDVSSFLNLDFRISRQLNVVDNPPGRTTFSIQLVLANGLSNPVSFCKYADLRGPVGGVRCTATSGGTCVSFETNYHPILQTVRIPLADFGNVDLTKVRGVRFSFNNTSSGSINVANIRFTRGQ
jgi:Bacterial Ig domain/IPT/TIG domain